MNILDLQYIESVEASEVQGAGRKRRKRRPIIVSRRFSANATADALADATGDRTTSDTFTDAIADADNGFSFSESSSSASASTTRFFVVH